MKTKIISAVVFVCILIFTLHSCTDQAYQVTPRPVKLDLGNSSTLNNRAKLGKVLFYDTQLSVNNGISCGTCHIQTLSFSDNKAFSSGFNNNLTLRNTLPIQNLSMDSKLFWDGRADNLQSMVLMPILNHVEMGMDDEAAVVERVRNLSYYHNLFESAFGSATVTSSGIAEALAAFVGVFRSSQSPFDQSFGNPSILTAIEQEGKHLFFDKYNCNSCHQTQTSSGYGHGGTEEGFTNIGLDVNYTDQGHENVTHDPADAGKFKIPSLRNVALTAPYMHDGRFATLEDVIEHYSHGIANHPNLDSRLKSTDGMPMQFNITDQEKTSLIAFLNSMTDFSLITNKELSNPFH